MVDPAGGMVFLVGELRHSGVSVMSVQGRRAKCPRRVGEKQVSTQQCAAGVRSYQNENSGFFGPTVDNFLAISVEVGKLAA